MNPKYDNKEKLNVSNKFNKSNKMKDYYRNEKRKFSSSSESTITIKDKNKDKNYYSSQKRSENSYKRNQDYKEDYKYEYKPYKKDRTISREREKYKDTRTNNKIK